MTYRRFARPGRVAAAGMAGIAGVAAIGIGVGNASPGGQASETATPIKHVVVIYQENVSFDHYFATYPQAANTPGEPRFRASSSTPSVNGLGIALNDPNNPNSTQPFRLDRSQNYTCDQGHGYTQEQQAYDQGAMDKFPETVGQAAANCASYGKGTGLVMGYYDGNTVTAMWNYAQNFAMSDNSFSTTFGPSTPGALNLVSGQTHGFTPTASQVTPNQTVIGDPQPANDTCDSATSQKTTSTDPGNKNIGDLLNAKKVTWGWFAGGFDSCTHQTANMSGAPVTDYIPHHEPFQYYQSTANPNHTPPSGLAEIGQSGPANHQYDLSWFQKALDGGNLPSVSFVKAIAAQDGHAGYSSPLDEQKFLVSTMNSIQKSQYWKDTAVVVAYDDSDGWYDHQTSPIVNQSHDPLVDKLTPTATSGGAGGCGNSTAPNAVLGGYQDRCGYGPRQPLLVISPYAKTNFVDHTITDQTSILRFVEDNWNTGTIGNGSFDQKANSLNAMFDFAPGHQGDNRGSGNGTLLLDPSTGQPAR
ncbi:MAG: Non-hemolytic phospholipase [Frankiales bacterium]|nr:Non-hemolytic phospholipase [Frankiales bacterium]